MSHNEIHMLFWCSFSYSNSISNKWLIVTHLYYQLLHSFYQAISNSNQTCLELNNVMVINTVSTGCSHIDGILGNGIPKGQLTLVYGESNTGKTTLAIQCAVVEPVMPAPIMETFRFILFSWKLLFFPWWNCCFIYCW